MTTVVKSFCRVCQAFCGYELTVEGNTITKMHGDKSDPASEGYVCFKGLRTIDHYQSGDRISQCLRRKNGQLVAADTQAVLDEAGQKLAQIISESGPQSVGFFTGTQALFNTLDPLMIGAFAQALGTHRSFTTMTIDQSAKWIAEERMGKWEAGSLPFDAADVWMLVGSNPMTSMVAAGGANQFVFSHPNKKMKRAKAGGMKLIVIDPRVTETAKMADLHLQPRPGRDAELAASILHVILREEWHDTEFCRDYVDHLDQLKQLVSPFGPQACAELIGVTPQEIDAAAAMFACEGTSGMTGTGTGVDMARFSNLAEHLWQTINVVCGRFPRAGDRISNPGVLSPPLEYRAQISESGREWENSPKSVKHGLGMIRGGLMSAEIVNEIMHDGPERMRAMICVGGNLHAALPDQELAQEALEALDLLIVIDPYHTGTTELADYVIAPKMQYERHDHTFILERMFNKPFGHWTAPVVDAPEGTVDDWYALWSLAKACGLELELMGQKLPMDSAPSSEELLSMVASLGQYPAEQLKEAEGALLADIDPAIVQLRENKQKFQLLPEDVVSEFMELTSQFQSLTEQGAMLSPLHMIVRRHKEAMNSTGTALEATRRQLGNNPAYICPEDMESLNLHDGDTITVRRADGKGSPLYASAKQDASMRAGVIAVSHGWSDDQNDPWRATNALVDAENDVQSINHMPVMTGIEILITPKTPRDERFENA
ncbi:hypothetical protein A8B75_18545 [Sphingomonadales bacterium EhC05]|nr:hypothetical protein A8B75_18545 [Sphingomonadales bacterium EhC05]